VENGNCGISVRHHQLQNQFKKITLKLLDPVIKIDESSSLMNFMQEMWLWAGFKLDIKWEVLSAS
jgi:hypothetical protein